MKTRRRGGRLLLASLCSWLVAACGVSDGAEQPLVVAAASDLRDVFGQLAGELVDSDVGAVSFVFGSSGMLREQILNGAPYDVYVSANVDFVEEVIAAGRALTAVPVVYAVGGLALVTADGRDVDSFARTVRSADRIVIAQPLHAPYGVAARQALERASLWSEVESRVVYADNVADAVRIVDSGEVDVGLVARSLVIDRPHVVVDPTLYDPLRQAAVALKNSRQARAKAFIDELRTDSVRRLLGRYGFATDSATIMGG